MLEATVVGWQEVRWLWQMRQNFIDQFVQLLKHCLCGMWSGIVVEKNWAYSVDQCSWEALPFLVHFINLLSILLRCNGLARIQKAVVDQSSSRPPNRDFFGANLALGSTFELLGPATELLITSCMQSIFHCTSQSDWEIINCYFID